MTLRHRGSIGTTQIRSQVDRLTRTHFGFVDGNSFELRIGFPVDRSDFKIHLLHNHTVITRRQQVLQRADRGDRCHHGSVHIAGKNIADIDRLVVFQVYLAGYRQSHFTQSALACGYCIKHDKVHQGRGQETIRCQLKVVLVDGVHAGGERHADRNHLRCRAQSAGNACRAILLKSSDDVERHRQLERVLNIGQQRYHISGRHGHICWTRGEVRVAERINSISVHISDGAVGAPTDVASNQFDID